MKKRASIEAAKWSVKRSDLYKRECEEILYKSNCNLQIDGSNVYIQSNNQMKFLVQITNSKTMWFEVWVKLANR